MALFFIQRPVFAWVISIIIMMAGVLSIQQLPVEQYPNIAPPSVSVTASYPGASAQTVENSVTQVIEQSLTGIDGLRYFTANSSSSGVASINITFEPGTDPDVAQVQVQNKVQKAIPLLPQDVQTQGVTVAKSSDSFLLVVGFYSKDGNVSQAVLGDVLTSKVQDRIARVNGVGNVTVFGDPYAMRIWLNPHQLESYNLTAMDVKAAISKQNADVSAGQIGGLPSTDTQQINATISAQSLLQTVAQFEDIILRVNTDGSQVRLKDVARVEKGSSGYSRVIRYKGLPAAGLAVSLASGANALDTADAVKAEVAALAPQLPQGIEVNYPYDTTPFVKVSIMGVVQTLIEAVILVFFVMFLFLQNFRATLIPTIAVPIVLLGTFAALYTFGYSINVLTMFAMVLAIGLLVDDAIVVVENVERVMSEEGLSPLEATKKSMRQITGALVGIALVLSAVFVPMAFFSGSAGAIYRQFSITIVSAMTLSVLVAIILTPTLCAGLLKPVKKGHGESTTGFFGWFNRNFNGVRHVFQKVSGVMSNRFIRFIFIYLGLLLALAGLFSKLPTSFLPDEDQGNMFFMVSAPSAATANRTLESVKEAEQYLLTQESDIVKDLFTVTGFSFMGESQNTAIGFVALEDWSQRKEEGQSVFDLTGRAFGAFSQIKDSMIFAFYPPAISELGNASGFDFQLLDRGGRGHEALMNARNQMLGMAAANPKLAGVRPNGLSDVPELKVNIDHEKAAALGVAIGDINETLQTAWGSSYVNDFLDAGRIKKVYVQADREYRMNEEDLDHWYVRNTSGEMVPFSSFTTTTWAYGSPKLERFNGVSSVNIQGSAAPGVSTGEAMAEMEAMVQKLPDGFDYAWTSLSYEEKASGSQVPLLYTLSVLIIFLCLAALYESWSIPFSVLMVVPLGVIGAVISAGLVGLNNDIYFQVALLTTVGLSAKNAILIVEFAKDLYEEGEELAQATLIAMKMRFRPIVMTSMAFILGVTPLALSSGAGSASQNAIGIGVMGGMVAATILVPLFVPMFYIFIQGLSAKRKLKKANAEG